MHGLLYPDFQRRPQVPVTREKSCRRFPHPSKVPLYVRKDHATYQLLAMGCGFRGFLLFQLSLFLMEKKNSPIASSHSLQIPDPDFDICKKYSLQSPNTCFILSSCSLRCSRNMMQNLAIVRATKRRSLCSIHLVTSLPVPSL